jgi:hypothetical protein
MQKKLLILIFLILGTALFGAGEYPCGVLMENISGSDMAFGLYGGTANVWYLSPQSIINNPAKLGFLDGAMLGYSIRQNYPDDKNRDDVYIHSSSVAYGKNGFGVILPFVNGYGKIGTTKFLGKFDEYDEYGNYIVTRKFYDTYQPFGIGINITKYFKKYSGILDDINFGVGVSIQSVQSDYSITEGKSHCFNTGLIGKYHKDFIKSIFETSIGCYFQNIFKNDIYYVDSSQSDVLPISKRFGGAAKYSLTLSSRKGTFYNFIRNFTNTFFSVVLNYDYADFDYWQTYNIGTEIAFFDIIGWRLSYYSESTDDNEGFIYSVGLHINYKNNYKFQFNFSGLDNSNGTYEPTVLDFSLGYVF